MAAVLDRKDPFLLLLPPSAVDPFCKEVQEEAAWDSAIKLAREGFFFLLGEGGGRSCCCFSGTGSKMPEATPYPCLMLPERVRESTEPLSEVGMNWERMKEQPFFSRSWVANDFKEPLLEGEEDPEGLLDCCSGCTDN